MIFRRDLITNLYKSALVCRVSMCYSLIIPQRDMIMNKFLETTADLPAHIYLLDSTKRLCYGYIKKGTKDPFMFSKPYKFDSRKRTFKEVR